MKKLIVALPCRWCYLTLWFVAGGMGWAVCQAAVGPSGQEENWPWNEHLMLIAFALAVILAVLGWNRLLRKQAAKRTRESETRLENELKFHNILFDTQLEASLDAILVVDEYNTILFFNNRFAELWGIPADILATRKDEIVLSFAINQLDDPQTFAAKVQYLYENRQEKSQDEFQLKDGRVIERYSAPMFGPDGQYLGRVWYFRDITARRRTEEALARERALADAVMDSVPGLLYLYDESGKLVRWNKRHQELTGYSPEELSQMTLTDWFKEDVETQGRIVREVHQSLEGGFVDTEANLRRKDGTTIPMYFTAVSLRIAGKLYFTGMGMDITKRRQMEDQLREINEELERKVEYRTQELTAMNQELIAMNQELVAANEELFHLNERLRETQESLVRAEKMAALARLVAGMAHEINTPVGICVTLASHLQEITKGMTGLYQSGGARRSDFQEYLAECEEAAGLLLLNTERAAKLVSNFKQVSADQASEIRRLFYVKGYIDEILTTLTARLKNSGHEVNVYCRDDLAIHGYPGAFAQILTNLVLNSLIHAYDSGEKGNMDIYAEVAGGQLKLIYKDDGKGMDKAVIGKIFDPFFTTRRNQGGTGLGLSIVYNLVTQLYNGMIQCTSQPGKGTTFTITLPLEIGEQNTEEAKQEA